MMKRVVPGILTVLFLLIGLQKAHAWGFWAHQRINRMAVFTLPPDMLALYKKNIEYLTEHAVDPDKRRYAVRGEAPRHYIDIDHYGDHPFDIMPKEWGDAVQKFSEDTLQTYGIVPWHIYRSYTWLVGAFREGNLDAIMKLSADMGHYIGDANVPLHTTENYNGQLTGQKGIHGLWESRLPEIFGEGYDYFIGKARYLDDVLEEAWSSVYESHMALDSVFAFEKIITAQIGSDQKYSFENRNNRLTKAYSKSFCTAYHEMLNGQVERRARASIVRVGSIWYSAWVDAGQPDLKKLMEKEIKQEEEKVDEKVRKKIKANDRESNDLGAVMGPYEMLFGNCQGHHMEVRHAHTPRQEVPHVHTHHLREKTGAEPQADACHKGLWPLRMRDL